MKWFGLANPNPSPNPNPNPNQVDDLMKWRWALRGNFWFDRIKAAEMPLCVEDELMRRGAHTRHMSAMRRAAGSIAQDAHRERGEHLPISPYISLYLLISPYISIHLPTSPYISLYLSISPYISLFKARGSNSRARRTYPGAGRSRPAPTWRRWRGWWPLNGARHDHRRWGEEHGTPRARPAHGARDRPDGSLAHPGPRTPRSGARVGESTPSPEPRLPPSASPRSRTPEAELARASPPRRGLPRLAGFGV